MDLFYLFDLWSMSLTQSLVALLQGSASNRHLFDVSQLPSQLKPFGLFYMVSITARGSEDQQLWNHTVYERQPDGRLHLEVSKMESMMQSDWTLNNYTDQVHEWFHTTTTEFPFADRHDGDWDLENSNPFYKDRTIHCHYVDNNKLTRHSYEHSGISDMKTYETLDDWCINITIFADWF